MPVDLFQGVGPDTPTRVLLVGNQWDLLQPALMSLADEGGMVFIDLAGRSFQEVTSRTTLSVVVIGPGSKDRLEKIPYRNLADERSVFPAVLVCITHESLENDDLYDGADDFLVVPCSAAELGKRIKRLVQKGPSPQPSTTLRVGKIVLDLDTYQVLVEGRRVDLAWMEFQLLKFLMENQGRVFTREQLLANVWGLDTFGGTRTVDVHIRRLRSKLGMPRDEYLRTVANVGYGMVNPQ